jgi:hypothetical protein
MMITLYMKRWLSVVYFIMRIRIGRSFHAIKEKKAEENNNIKGRVVRWYGVERDPKRQ